MVKALGASQLVCLIAHTFAFGPTEAYTADPPIVRLFSVTRGQLQSRESNRVLHWDNNPSRGYMATQVALQLTIE
jgi:hypothetical protein